MENDQVTSRHDLLLKYGPREKEVFEELSRLSDFLEFGDNKSEILRRGLHIYRNMVEADLDVILRLLSNQMHAISKEPRIEEIRIARYFALLAHSVMIAKRGLAHAELFESIPSSLMEIEQSYSVALQKMKSDPKYDPKLNLVSLESVAYIKQLATILDSVFRKQHNTFEENRDVFISAKQLASRIFDEPIKPKLPEKETGKRREKLELLIDFLDSLNKSTKMKDISPSTERRYLEFLLETGIIKFHKSSKTYKITKKGRLFRSLFRNDEQARNVVRGLSQIYE
jgi:predicted transcriptional regulator